MKVNNKTNYNITVNQVSKWLIAESVKKLVDKYPVPDGIVLNGKEHDEFKRHLMKHANAIAKQYSNEKVTKELDGIVVDEDESEVVASDVRVIDIPTNQPNLRFPTDIDGFLEV